MAEKSKGQRGGTRPGAGRPNIYGQGLRQKKFYVQVDQYEWLQEEARKAGVSVSAFLRDLVGEYRTKLERVRKALGKGGDQDA